MTTQYRRKSTVGVEAFDSIVLELNYLHRYQNMSWRQIASTPKFKGVAHSTLRDVANGKEPKSNKIREILGLPLIKVKIVYKTDRSPKAIQDMTVKELLWALQNREEI